MLAAEVVIAGHDENILRLQSERLQDGLKKDFTSRLIFLRLSAKRHVAAEDAKINLAQRRVDVPPLAQVGEKAIEDHLPVKVAAFLVPVRKMEPAQPGHGVSQVSGVLSD